MRAQPKRMILVGAAVAMSPGCHSVKTPASAIRMADPATANQLIYGFYGVEMHAWRWTAGTFAKPDTHVYWRDVPSEVLDSNIVPFVFRLDRYVPWAAKGREMGAVFNAVALLPN